MADPEVKLKFAGSSADAERAISTLEKKIQQLEQGLKHLSSRTKSDAKAAADAWKGLQDNASGFVQSVTGISGPLGLALAGTKLLKNEWEDLLERQQKALNANKTYASSLETLAFNTAGDAKYDSLAKVETLIKTISKGTGVGINQVASALSNAASAKGQLPLEDAADAVRTVLTFAPNTPGLIDVMSGAALDVRKMFPRASAEDAVGFTAMLGQQSRITDPAKVAENALPAALLMTKVDKGSLRENAAIYAAITQATGDVMGRTSRTGGIALALQLEKALPDLKTTKDRVDFMQNNPELAHQFLEGGGKFKGKGLSFDAQGPNGEDMSFGTDRATFEKKVLPAIRELLSKGSTTDINLRSALTAIPEIDQGHKVFQQQMEGLRKSESLVVANRDRRLGASAERARLGNVQGAEQSSTRTRADELLSDHGFGWGARQMMAWRGAIKGAWSGDDAGGRIASIEQHRDRLQMQHDDKWFTGQQARDTERELNALNEILAELKAGRLADGKGGPAAIEPRQNDRGGDGKGGPAAMEPRLNGQLPGDRDRPRPGEVPGMGADPESVDEIKSRQKGISQKLTQARAEGDSLSIEVLKKQLEATYDLLAVVKEKTKRPLNRNGQVEG